MALREIDTREIQGVSTVSWHYDGTTHYVQVTTAADGLVAHTITEDGFEAHDAFSHPFARQDVPNVFAGV